MVDINALGQKLSDKIAVVVESFINDELKELNLEGVEKENIVIRAAVGLLVASISHFEPQDMQNVAFSIIANLTNNVGLMLTKMMRENVQKSGDDIDRTLPEGLVN